MFNLGLGWISGLDLGLGMELWFGLGLCLRFRLVLGNRVIL